MQFWKAFLLLLAITTTSCSQKESKESAGRHPVVAGTTNKFFTAKSSYEIQHAEGTKVIPIPGQNGKPLGFIIVARDNEMTGVSCSGGCSNSEGNPCGGCVPQEGLPDSIITCACISACIGSCGVNQITFGGLWAP